MGVWFQCKVKFLKETGEGLLKSVTEQYLIDALSFAEAEGRVLEEMPNGRGEINMMSITKSPIREVAFYGDTDLWFKAKVSYVVADDETEKEKKVTTYILVNSADVREAYDRVQEHLKEMLVPFVISKVEETPIVDVFEHKKRAPEGFKKVEKEENPSNEEAPEGAEAQPEEVDEFAGDF